jgi:LPS export ABC transporter protein LptC
VAILIVALGSCSLDYSQVSVTEEMSREIPDSILRDFTYTVVEQGVPTYRLEGDVAEFYTNRKRTDIEGLLFREYDRSGNLVTEGNADRAVFFTDTENAELEGNLLFYSAAEEATVVTDYLSWNSEEKLLAGSSTGRVTVTEDSGSKLSGTGFEADISRRRVDFSGPVAGRLVVDE